MMLLNKKGFTLIELALVIAIISILAAVALPKMFSLNTDAQTNATANIAGSLAAASGENSAVRTVNATKGQAVANCTDVGLLLQGGLPTGYSITAAAITAGSTATCTLKGPSSSTATFTAAGIS